MQKMRTVRMDKGMVEMTINGLSLPCFPPFLLSIRLPISGSKTALTSFAARMIKVTITILDASIMPEPL